IIHLNTFTIVLFDIIIFVYDCIYIYNVISDNGTIISTNSNTGNKSIILHLVKKNVLNDSYNNFKNTNNLYASVLNVILLIFCIISF
ncbi:MAG: hypothetical protein ACRCVG_03165, partial [Methanobacteriaceae archaeon]